MSNPTISIPRSQKRWPISTIFTPEKMRTAFVSSSIQFTIHLWKFVEDHHTTFVTPIIPLSSPISYHLRSTKIFQPPINQSIPKFPSFPNFPSFPRIPAFPHFPQFPRFPRFPAFPCFPHFPHFPHHPQLSTAQAPSVATENRQGHCLTKISIIRLIRSFIFLFAETIVINLINCQPIVLNCLTKNNRCQKAQLPYSLTP